MNRDEREALTAKLADPVTRQKMTGKECRLIAAEIRRLVEGLERIVNREIADDDSVIEFAARLLEGNDGKD